MQQNSVCTFGGISENKLLHYKKMHRCAFLSAIVGEIRSTRNVTRFFGPSFKVLSIEKDCYRMYEWLLCRYYLYLWAAPMPCCGFKQFSQDQDSSFKKVRIRQSFCAVTKEGSSFFFVFYLFRSRFLCKEWSETPNKENLFWVRETNRKSAETDWVSSLFLFEPKTIVVLFR
jgi:hypothetical protein